MQAVAVAGWTGEVSLPDENGAVLRTPHIAGFVTYYAGPLQMGALWEYARWGARPESLMPDEDMVAADRAAARANFISYDFYLNSTIFFAKYDNGRFFFNVEADIMESMMRRERPAAGNYFTQTSVDPTSAASGSLWQAGHTWAKRFYTELGTYVGPAKFTALGAWVDGYDRRHGVLIDKQGTGLWLGPSQDGLANWFDSGPNGIIFYPYRHLIVLSYGGGNNQFNSSSTVE
jgi:hypothetical protein